MSDLRATSLIAVVLAATLAGCGDNKTETTASTEAQAPATPQTTSPPASAPEATPPSDTPAAGSAAPATTATTTSSSAAADAASVTYASLTGDAAKGEKVFGQCRTCHVVQQGVNRVGPSLWGVVGRKAGSVAGYKYSTANLNSGFVWNEDQLFTYLEAPQKVMKGTKMAFGGLKKPQDRADVIAYLKSQA